MKEEFIYENIRIIDVIAMKNKYLIFLLEQMVSKYFRQIYQVKAFKKNDKTMLKRTRSINSCFAKHSGCEPAASPIFLL